MQCVRRLDNLVMFRAFSRPSGFWGKDDPRKSEEGTSRTVQMRRVEDQWQSIRERIGVAWQLAVEQPWEQPVAGRLRTTTACCTNLCWARSSPQPVSSSSAQPAGGLAPPAGEVRRTEIVRLR